MSSGTVHVYLIDPDGRPIGSQHVATASKVEALTELLEKTIAEHKLTAGKTLVPPAPQSHTPKAASDDLVLHLVARNVDRKAGVDTPRRTKLGLTRSGNWGAYPAEDWIILKKDEWSRLVPKEIKAGTTWELDRDAAARVLLHVYPSTENNNIKTNRIDRQELKGTIRSIKDGVAHARLDGALRMKHPFYHKDDDNFVDTRLLGYLDIEVATGRIVRWEVATRDATYGRINFGVVVTTR
ncbi:MAG: hypothetical protein U0793_06965 [Gemmataceae bacterium]